MNIFLFHNFRRGLYLQECIDELKFLYDDEAVVPKNIDAVRELIIQERHVTYREISAINMPSILHEHLAVKNICFR